MSVKAVLVDGMVVLDDSVVGERTVIAGSSPGPQVDLSTLGNGALQQTVSGGVATLSVYTPANNAAKYIVQQPDSSLPNAQALSALTTGLVKNTTATGVLSIAVAGVDYVVPSGVFYQTMQVGGASQTQRGRLNFISGATLTDNAGNNSTDVFISGASVYTDGIATGVTELVSVPAALLQPGTLAYVNSVDDYFALVASTLTPDNLTVVAANGKAGYNWHRLIVFSERSQAVTTWFIDTANGNDEGVGTSSITALATYSELARRLSRAIFTHSVSITVTGDQSVNDKPVFTYKTTAEQQVTFVGVPTLLYTGTVTSYAAATLGTPAADDNSLTDNGIPTSYTASGLMAAGVQFARTNGTPCVFWAAKDKGSKTIRVSWPTNISSPTSTFNLSPGDTYTASALPLLSAAIFPVQQEFGTVIKNFRSTRFNNPGGEAIFYQQMWFSSSGRDGGVYYNSVFTSGYSWGVNGGSTTTQLLGGMLLGTGTSGFPFFGSERISTEGAPFMSQGAAIILEIGQMIAFQINFYDVTAPLNGVLQVLTGAQFQTTVGCIGGSGNTVPMLYVNRGVVINPSITDASTSAAHSVVVNGSNYSAADLPVNDINSGSFVGPNSAPLGDGVLRSNASGEVSLLTIGAGLTYGAGTLSATSVATWNPSVFAVFAVDYDNGNDANAGFAIAASSSYADFQAAVVAAGAVAKKTMQGLGAIFPEVGAGRMAFVAIASRAGGATYLKQDAVTVDTLDSFMSGRDGYDLIAIWGTGTNSTAGATKFTGTVSDLTYAGAVPVAGTNAAGYHPTAGATASTVPCLQVGGSPPALAGEPAAPLGWSTRYDVATSTAALRNVCRGTQIVSTTTTTNDTVSPQVAWPATPATSDTFYLEQPGVVCNGWGTAWGPGNSKVIICGIRALTLTNYTTGPLGIAQLKHMFVGMAGSTSLGTAACGIQALSATDPGVGSGTITRGSSLRSEGAALIQPGTPFPQMFSPVFAGNVLLEFPGFGTWNTGAVFAAGVHIQGGTGALSANNPVLGTSSAALQCRIIGPGASAGLTLDGCRINIKDCQITGMGALPAIKLNGQCELWIQSTPGSTGNTDVGLDLTNAQGSLVVIQTGTTPTVTGAAGDVRLGDGTIVTWAQAATGIQDAAGNRIMSGSAWPIQRLPTGAYLTDLSAGGFVKAAAGTGLLSVDIVPGASIYADGIVTGTVQLASLGAALLQAGTIAYVNSVDDSFQLQASPATPDNITIVAASGKAGFNWVRLGIYSARWAAVTAWTLDPANVSTTASDENPATGNLLTYSELARRLSQVVFTAPITISVISDQQPSDKPVFTYKTTAEQQVNFVGVPTVLHTGTVTSYTPATLGTPAADDNQMVDTGIPVSFTASGLMAAGVLFTRTNGTQVEWWAAKDLGSKTIRTSWPFNLAAVLTNPVLSPGDTYTASSLPLMSNAIFPVQQEFGTTIKHFKISRFNAPGGESIFYQENWFTAQGRDGGAFYNCAFDHGYGWGANGGTSEGPLVLGGLLTGTTTYEIAQISSFSTEGNALTVQTANMVVELTGMVAFQINFYDCAGPDACINVITNARYQQTAGCFGGKNNTVPIISVANGYAVGVALTDASTSAAHSVLVNGVGYNAADLPVSDVNSQSYVGAAQLPLGAGLVQSNASGLLSLATVGSGLVFSGGVLKASGPATTVAYFDAVGNLTGDHLFSYNTDGTSHVVMIDSAGTPGILSGTSSGSSLQRQVSIVRDGGALPAGISPGLSIEGYSSVGSGQGGRLNFMGAGGTRAAPAASPAGAASGAINTLMYDGTNWLTTIRFVTFTPPGTVGTGNYPSAFSIQQNAAGVSGTLSLDSEVGFQVDTSFNVVLGQKDLASTSATGDSVWFPVVNGVPTGIPAIVDATAQGSRVAFKVDPVHGRGYFYNGGWQPWAQYDGAFGPAIIQTDASGVHSAVTIGAGLSYSGGTLSSTLSAPFYQFVDDPAVGTQPQRGHLGFGYNGSTLVTTDDPVNDRTNVEMAIVAGNPFDTGATTLPGRIITNSFGQVVLANSITVGSGLSLSGGVLSATGGGGTVTNVSALAPIFVANPTTTPQISIQGAITSGSTSTTPQSLGALTNGTLQQTVSAGVATISAFNGTTGSVPFYAANGQLAQDNSNFFWDATNHRLGILTNAPSYPLDIASGVSGVIGFRVYNTTNGTNAQVQNIVQNSAGSLGYFGITAPSYSAYTPINGGRSFFGGLGSAVSIFTQSAFDIVFSTNGSEVGRFLSGGGFQVANLSAGGLVKAAATTGKLGIAAAGTDYQVPIAWPAAGEILYSSGTSTPPSGNANLVVDTTFGQTVVIGGTTANSQGNQLRVVPQASLVATSAFGPDTLLVDGQTVTLTSPVNINYGGGYDTVRVQPTTYTAGSAITMLAAASVKIEGDPVGGTNVTITNPYALWIGGGHTRVDGALRLSSITGPAYLQVDASGNVSAGSTAPLPFASYKFSISASQSGGIVYQQGSVIVPGDSGAITTSAGIYNVAVGTAISDTLGANYGTAGGITAYRVNRAATSFTVQFTQLSATVTAANGANMGYALYTSHSPFSNAWTQLGGFSTGPMNIGTLANSGLASSIISGSCSIAAGDVIAIAAWRTDVASSSILNPVMFSATVELMD